MDPRESALRDLFASLVTALGVYGVDVSDGSQAVVTGVLTGAWVAVTAVAHFVSARRKRFGR